MIYAQKDDAGNVIGLYANPQPGGVPTVEVDDNDATVIAYKATFVRLPEPSKEELISQINALMEKVKALP